MYAAPRWLTWVSPEPWNEPRLATVASTPAAAIRANTLGCGCQLAGSTDPSQVRAFNSRIVPGIRLV
jgi:hypothetical protein